MMSLRLFETGGALIAEDPAPRLFETPPRRERYRRSRWPYATSAVLHAISLVSVVILVRAFTRPPPPTPAPPVRNVTSAFVLSTISVESSRHRRPINIRPSKPRPVAIAGVAAAPLPAALGDSRVADTIAIPEEKPLQSAFGLPIPVGDARVQGRRGDPSEAGLGSASVNVRGSPTAAIRPGGLGEGSTGDVRNGASTFSVRPGFGDGPGGDGGGTPPRIQEPLPVPDYPTDARTHRLQGVVVLEVMLDTLGKAHVRGVLSRPLGFGIEEAARNAAERLKFTPARQGGRSVDAIVQVRVTFTLTDDGETAATGGA